MKVPSRPHPSPSSRSAPYRKTNGAFSPTRRTRWPHDASQPQRTPDMISPRHPDRAPNPRRSFPKKGGNRAASRTRGHTSMDQSSGEWPSHTRGFSIHPDASGPSPLPLTSTPLNTTGNAVTGQREAESPQPGSVTAFLRSIELPDKPSSTPPLQTSFSLTRPSLPSRLPPLSTDAGNTNKAACTNENGYQVSLVYKGYPFTYDLSALPDDPKSTIALLTITKSDPGAYLLVGAHYRRTVRSRAACTVIRSLLDNLDSPSDVEKRMGETPIPTSAASTVTLVSPNSPCSKPADWTKSVFKSTAVRPAMLLLAACELDISRENPDDPESADHAYTAHDLFRVVYGTVNDAILAGAVRPQPKNALGLEFASNCQPSSPSDSNHDPPTSASPREAGSPARVNGLEKELSAAHAARKKLQEKLTTSNARLTRAEGKVHALESHSREVLVQLDAWRDDNWKLRERLAESEQRVRELVQCTPSAESRVWERLKDLLFDNLGEGRGE